jgi:hypothetical protein
MNKIPVGQVVGRAYAFTFGEIGTVIGLIWIPTVLSVVGNFFVQRMLASQPLPDAAGPPGMPAGFGFLMLYLVASLLFTAMIAVALTRQVLGLRQGTAFAHVALGGEEFRVFGAFVIVYLLTFVFAIAVAIVLAIAVSLLVALVPDKTVGEAAAAAVGGVGTLVGLGGLIYVLARLSFFMIPSAVADGEFGLTKSWQLTQGNFWRIMGVACGTVFPLLIVIFVVEFFIFGPEYFATLRQMFGDPTHAAKYAAAQQAIAQQKTPILLGFALLAAPIINGLIFTPAAFAYSAVAGSVRVASQNVE